MQETYIVCTEDSFFKYVGEITPAIQCASDDGIFHVIRASDGFILTDDGWEELDLMPDVLLEDEEEEKDDDEMEDIPEEE